MDTVPTLKHADVLWNEEIQEWFCARCGRTSDHTTKADALVELEQYECELPTKTQSKEVPPDFREIIRGGACESYRSIQDVG